MIIGAAFSFFVRFGNHLSEFISLCRHTPPQLPAPLRAMDRRRSCASPTSRNRSSSTESVASAGQGSPPAARRSCAPSPGGFVVHQWARKPPPWQKDRQEPGVKIDHNLTFQGIPVRPEPICQLTHQSVFRIESEMQHPRFVLGGNPDGHRPFQVTESRVVQHLPQLLICFIPAVPQYQRREVTGIKARVRARMGTAKPLRIAPSAAISRLRNPLASVSERCRK